MCGLIGVITGKHKKTHEDLFSNGLVVDTIRGKHSTGAVAVQDSDYLYHKAAVPGVDFIESKQYESLLRKLKLNNPAALLGHNRAATVGKVNKCNAHPFEFQNIIGMHNGTLRRKYKLENDGDYETDSETLFDHIKHHGIDDALPKVDGAYCLVWYDEDSNRVYIIRNDERPLFFGKVKDEDTVIYGSEMGMIFWLCDRHNLQLEDIYTVETDHLYHFDLDAKEVAKPHIRKINTVSEYPKQQTNYGQYSGNNYTGGRNVNTGNQGKGKGNGEVEPQKVMRDYGLHKGQIVTSIPREFKPYPKNRNKGQVTGFMSKKPFLDFVVHGVDRADYDAMDEREFLEVQTVTRVQNTLFVVCTTVKDDVTANEPESDNVTDITARDIVVAGDHSQKKYTDSTVLRGPEGMYYTVAELDKFAAVGCGMCGDQIPREDYEELEWHKDNTPICPYCVDEWYHTFYN